MITKKSILIVDDDIFVREMIASILEELSGTLYQADDGESALALFKNHPEIGLILTDLHMPNMDGISLVREIRTFDAQIPIILLTVNTEIEKALQAIREGADDYIIKGNMIAETLPLAIAKVLELYELRAHNQELLLQLSRKNRELEKLASLDALTGVANRHHFDLSYAAEWREAMKNQTPLALIFCDMDHFKDMNDTYGHQFGDLCIQKTAQTLDFSLIGHLNSIARYGGDEFVAILPKTDLEKAVKIAERMHKAVMEMEIYDENLQITKTLTMSMGVHSLIPEEGMKPRVLIEETDKALYRAKEAGRACIRT